MSLNRRFVPVFLCLLVACQLCVAQAQQPPRRVGYLTIGTPATSSHLLRAFTENLQRRGFAEGRDVEFVVRYAMGREQALDKLAREIAERRPALVLAPGTVVAEAMKKAAPGTPIITLTGDITGTGLAATLARPGSVVTGVSFLSSALDAKRLELLAELLPKGSTILNLSDSSARAGSHAALGDAARALGITLHSVEARTPAEIDLAFDAARKLQVSGINVLTSPFLNTERARIIKLGAQARLPAIYQWPESAEEGGLIGYGPRLTEIYRQLASYAARILQGANPADLAVEQPTKFELVINAKTASALGIRIPQSLLVRADRVIE